MFERAGKKKLTQASGQILSSGMAGMASADRSMKGNGNGSRGVSIKTLNRWVWVCSITNLANEAVRDMKQTEREAEKCIAIRGKGDVEQKRWINALINAIVRRISIESSKRSEANK